MEFNIELLSLGNDPKFDSIPGMTWYPWVGCNYFTAKRRVLIVGESQYNKGKEADLANLKSMNRKWETRNVVQNFPVSHSEDINMYENLYRCLFRTITIDRESVWKNISFYNFIQRPMNYNCQERPRDDDFKTGWKVFIEVIKILRPTDCIFVGVAAADRFNDCAIDNKWKYIGVEWKKVEKVRNYARHFSISIDDYSLKCIAIQHTSHHFSWSAWHNYLKGTNKEMMLYLNGLAHISSVPNDNNEPQEENKGIDIPFWLKHKPIYCCDYSKIAPNSDLKIISIGRAQWDNHFSLSAKTIRYDKDGHISRMSEEVPVDRLSEMAVVLLSAIRAIQLHRANSEMRHSYLKEFFVTEEYEFLEDQFSKDSKSLRKSLSEIKRLINEIDLDNI